jgi:hypothetical protein
VILLAPKSQAIRLVNACTLINGSSPKGLSVSVRPVRELLREIVAGVCVQYLVGLPARLVGSRKVVVGGGGGGGRRKVRVESVAGVAKMVVCEALVGARQFVREALVGKCLDTEVFWRKVKSENDGESTTVVVDGRPDDPIEIVKVDGVYGGRERLRIDCLLGIETRLWKELRSALKVLYIQTLIVNGDYFKKLMGIIFVYSIMYFICILIFFYQRFDSFIITP